MKKERLDRLLIEKGLAENLKTARALIGAGRVLVDGQPEDKAGSVFDASCRLDLKEKQRYVSRGGLKLEAGLQTFGVEPRGMICADIGCSTGGFTDCLLQHGAARVYSIDVGYGVLDWKLRQDSRVVVLERKNARYLSGADIPESIDLAVIDASFISLELLLEPVCRLFAGRVAIIALVKPQFELPRDKVARGGVVEDEALHMEVLDKVGTFAASLGLVSRKTAPSPIRGAKGNREFLMYITGDRQGKTD